MNAFIFRLSLVVLLFYSSFLSASVYRCVIDGVTTFSQTPCADNAEKIQGYDTTPTRSAPQATSQSTEPTASQSELAQVNTEVRKRRLNRQIQQLEQRVNRLQRDYEEEFMELTGEPLPEGDRMAAYPVGLAQEIVVVRNRYDAEIKKAREELVQRRKELEDLRG
ncbi:MAG: DUF4124 domain-containing protein [Alkalimonas sp.]|nr:DUF4124 domain-containing protein [Alkalimonas sp.]